LIAQFGFTKEPFSLLPTTHTLAINVNMAMSVTLRVCDSDDTLIVIKELINKFGIRQELINCETISQNPGTGSV